MSLPAQQVICSPWLADQPTCPTAPAGDSSLIVANTKFVTSTVTNAFNEANVTNTPKVQQGTGVDQLQDDVKIGWSGTQLLVTVDNTNLGNLLFGTDYTAIENQISALQNSVNNTIANWLNKPFAYTGINQDVSFGNLSATSLTSLNDIWAFASDERLKENIRPIQDALSKVHQITGFLYNFTEEAHRLGGYDPEREHMGVSAQSVQRVAPQVVGLAPFDKDNTTKESKSGENYLTVQYEKLVSLVIEAVKELDYKVEALDEKLDRIQALIDQE